MFAGEFCPSNSEISAGVKVAVDLAWRAIEQVLEGDKANLELWSEAIMSPPDKKRGVLYPLADISRETNQTVWQVLKKRLTENLGVNWSQREEDPKFLSEADEHSGRYTYRTTKPGIVVVSKLWYPDDVEPAEGETISIINLNPKSLKEKLDERFLAVLRGETKPPASFPKWK